MARKALLFLIISIGVGVALFVSALETQNPAVIIKTFLAVHPWKVLLLLLSALVTHLISTVRWRHLLRYTGSKLGFIKSFRYYLMGFGVSFLTPIAQLGGRPIKAFGVSRVEDIPLKNSLVSVFLEIFLEFSVEVIIIIAALPFLFINYSFPQRFEWSLGVSFLVLALLIVYLHRELRRGRRILSWIMKRLRLHKYLAKNGSAEAVADGERVFVGYFHRKNNGGALGIAISVLIFLFGSLEIGVLFWLLDLPVSVLNILIAKVFLNIAYLIPVPGALGVAEWLQAAFFSTILGVSAGIGVAFSIIVKGRDIFYTLIGLAFLAFTLTRHSLRQRLEGLSLKRLLTELKEE